MILQRNLIDQADPAIEDFYRQQANQGMLFSARISTAHYTRYPGFRRRWGSLLIMAARGVPESYYIDNRRLQVNNYSYLLIDASTRYEYRLKAEAPNHSVMVSFPTGLVDEFLYPDTYARQSGTSARDTSPFLLAQGLHAHDRQVSPLLFEMVQRLDAGCTETMWYEERMRELLSQLLFRHQTMLVGLSRLRAAKYETKRSLARRIQRSIDLIHERYNDALTLKDLSRAACMSPYHFLRSFRSLHETTPSRYLQQTRINVARQILRSADTPVAKICSLTGFGNRSAFHRAFKRHAGVTPDQFRKSASCRRWGI